MNSIDSRQVLGAFALIQLNERLEDMRTKLNDGSLTNNDILMISSDLQSIYKKLIMSDLDSAITRSLETYMWNDCFKTPLTRFGRSDKAMFNLIIESGVGFYLGFIQDIGIHFDVPFIKNTTARALYCTTPNILKSILKCHPSKSSVYYIIQNSLVHVGDLLRYRGSFPEALKMYEKSTAVSPTNGHPFNQMGLVQLLIDGKSVDSLLSAIYYYARAVCVANAFPPAQNNLDTLIGRVKNVKPCNKVEDFICQFLMGIGNPETFVASPSMYVTLLSPLVMIGAISSNQLFRIIVVTLWAWKRESDKTLLSSSSNEGFLLEIIASVINSLLIAANGFTDIAQFYAIPHLKMLLDWLKINNSVLSNPSFRTKLHTGTLCAFLNNLLIYENDLLALLVCGELEFIILAEEKKLLGFLPFGRSYEQYQALMDCSDQRATPIRILRILRAAESLSSSRLGFLERSGLTFTEIPFMSQVPSVIRAPSRRNVALQSILNQFSSPASTNSGDGGQLSYEGGLSESATSTSSTTSRNNTPNSELGSIQTQQVVPQQNEYSCFQQQFFSGFKGLDGSGDKNEYNSGIQGNDSIKLTESNGKKEYFGYDKTGLFLHTPPDLSSSTSLDVDIESTTDFSQIFRSIWTPLQPDEISDESNDNW